MDLLSKEREQKRWRVWLTNGQEFVVMGHMDFSRPLNPQTDPPWLPTEDGTHIRNDAIVAVKEL